MYSTKIKYPIIKFQEMFFPVRVSQTVTQCSPTHNPVSHLFIRHYYSCKLSIHGAHGTRPSVTVKNIILVYRHFSSCLVWPSITSARMCLTAERSLRGHMNSTVLRLIAPSIAHIRNSMNYLTKRMRSIHRSVSQPGFHSNCNRGVRELSIFYSVQH